MPNELEQRAAQAFADRVEWWEDCPDTLDRWLDDMDRHVTYGGRCPTCKGTGKVLRYPHLFKAMYEDDHAQGCDIWEVPWQPCTCSGYAIRPVMEIWWLLPAALRATHLSIDAAWADEKHPILATFAALEKAIGRKS